jgi:hypothetical protein
MVYIWVYDSQTLRKLCQCAVNVSPELYADSYSISRAYNEMAFALCVLAIYIFIRRQRGLVRG